MGKYIVAVHTRCRNCNLTVALSPSLRNSCVDIQVALFFGLISLGFRGCLMVLFFFKKDNQTLLGKNSSCYDSDNECSSYSDANIKILLNIYLYINAVVLFLCMAVKKLCHLLLLCEFFDVID